MRARLLFGYLTIGTSRFRAAAGRAGIVANKREGDGGTPTGLLPLRQVFYRPDRVAPPICAVPVRALSPADGWCDDPAHPAYNRLIRLPGTASAEHLWRNDCIYDIIGVLGWNDQPIVPHLGSAIFLHVARADFSLTEGCIALAPDDLRFTLAAGLTDILV